MPAAIPRYARRSSAEVAKERRAANQFVGRVRLDSSAIERGVLACKRPANQRPIGIESLKTLSILDWLFK